MGQTLPSGLKVHYSDCCSTTIEKLHYKIETSHYTENETSSLTITLYRPTTNRPLSWTKQLPQHVTDVTSLEEIGNTKLMWACFFGHSSCVRSMLLRGNVDVNAANIFGDTALIYACEIKDISLAKLLLNKAHVNATNNDGDTALLKACQNELYGVVKIVKSLTLRWLGFGEDRDSVFWHYREGDLCHCQLAEFLLQHGADVNASNHYGNTPLIFACVNSHYNLAELLLRYKADVHAVDNQLFTALLRASKNGNYRVSSLLLERNADANVLSGEGFTALMYSCKAGNLPLAQLLLLHNANMNARTLDGDTALMLACIEGRSDVVSLLMQHGADGNIVGSNGFTALMHACERGHLECAKALLLHNVLVDIQSKEGHTALMFACKNENYHLVSVLLQRRSSVNIMCNSGHTALAIAWTLQSREIVRLLVRHGASEGCIRGADINARGDENRGQEKRGSLNTLTSVPEDTQDACQGAVGFSFEQCTPQGTKDLAKRAGKKLEDQKSNRTKRTSRNAVLPRRRSQSPLKRPINIIRTLNISTTSNVKVEGKPQNVNIDNAQFVAPNGTINSFCSSSLEKKGGSDSDSETEAPPSEEDSE